LSSATLASAGNGSTVLDLANLGHSAVSNNMHDQIRR